MMILKLSIECGFEDFWYQKGSFMRKVLLNALLTTCAGFLLSGMPVYAEGNILTVSKDGTCQFATITEAVTAAESGDSIYIGPGVYEEAVDTGAKELALVGTDRAACILQNDTESYFTPPLNMACGRVENLTIRANRKRTGSTIDENISPSYLHAGAPGIAKADFTDYAIHVESPASTGHNVTIRHCDLRSDCNHVLGMGLHGNMNVLIEDCTIYSGGAGFLIGMHDAEKCGFGPAAVTFRDLTMAAENACPSMMLMSIHPELSRISMNFQNVHVLVGTDGTVSVTNMNGLPGDGYMGTQAFVLAKGSEEGPVYHAPERVANVPEQAEDLKQTLEEGV